MNTKTTTGAILALSMVSFAASGPAQANDKGAPEAAASDLSPSVHSAVRHAVARHRRGRSEAFTMKRPLSDLGVDVLALVSIVAELESRFDVELAPDDVLSWSTPADMAGAIEVALRDHLPLRIEDSSLLDGAQAG